MGSHEELLAIDGHYKNLYELQFRKKEAVVQGIVSPTR